MSIPSRIDLAGGWLDQPWVSMYAPGPVITMSIQHNEAFYGRGGMASSTRDRAIKLWGDHLPPIDPAQAAEILFAYDNIPGCEFISGSQDALGICLPGVHCLQYTAKYWPTNIKTLIDPQILSWLEKRIKLLPLGPRPGSYSVLSRTSITKAWAKQLADAANNTWDAVVRTDFDDFASSVYDSFVAQCAMFPLMADDDTISKVGDYRDLGYGAKITGAGGGGFLVIITEDDIPGSIEVQSRV